MIRSGSWSALRTMRAPVAASSLELQRIDGVRRAQQRDPAADDVALGERGADRGERVLDARLALLHLGLGGRADLDDRDAPDEAGEPLLELLAVPVGLGLLDLAADVLGAGVDGGAVAAAAEDGGVLLGDDDPVGAAELVEADGVEAKAHLLADHGGAGEDGDVGEDRGAAVAERGRLDRDRGERAAQAVDHQRRQGLGLHVLGDDQQRAARTGRRARAPAAGRRPR